MGYTSLEKAFLSLAGLPCLILAVCIYRYAKRNLLDNESMGRRMEPWYAAMSGGMLGIFIFRTLPQSAAVVTIGTSTTSPAIEHIGWSYRALAAFVMAGFYVLMWVDKVGRVCTYNSATYPGLSPLEANDDSDDLSHIMDKEAMQVTDYHESQNVQSDAYPTELHLLQAENHAANRRKWHALLLYALMIFVCIVEGLYLVYRQNVAAGGSAGLICSFYVDKLLETVVVCTILVHGLFHLSPRHRVYWLLGGGWITTIILSSVPVLSDAPIQVIATAVEHPAMSVIYAIAAGFIFYTSIHFINVNRARTNRRDMILRMLVFGAGAWIPFVTGLFM